MTTTLLAVQAISKCEGCELFFVGLVDGRWTHLTDRCAFCYTGHGTEVDEECCFSHGADLERPALPCADARPEMCPAACGHPTNVEYQCDTCAEDCCGICCVA